jgi:predicted HTH transcriptional regulator
MKSWLPRATQLLAGLAGHAPHRLDELQICDLRIDLDTCADHLCALANHPGGGVLVFGVDDLGTVLTYPSANPEQIADVVRDLARSTSVPVFIDHAIETADQGWTLFIQVYESAVKPVIRAGLLMEQAPVRANGMTRQATRQELGGLLLNSQALRWEELKASVLWDHHRVLAELDIVGIAQLVNRPIPTNEQESIRLLADQGLIERHGDDGCYITNLGAIAAARRLSTFPDIARKAMRVIVYDGTTRQQARYEQEGRMGYAVSFDRLMSFVTTQLPQSEVIDRAFRQKMPIYPEIALREVIANALIHQDFSVSGAGPVVEIFSDRIEISNPGGLLPSKRADRLFSTSSESRNERLARTFRLYGICEERGSGLFRAGRAVELYGLPPVRFDASPNHFKVTLYSPKTYAQMAVAERLQACYQHAVIQYVAGEFMTNKSLRERLRMPEARRSMVSTLIQQAQDAALIKPADPDNRSKKFMQYLPFWA